MGTCRKIPKKAQRWRWCPNQGGVRAGMESGGLDGQVPQVPLSRWGICSSHNIRQIIASGNFCADEAERDRFWGNCHFSRDSMILSWFPSARLEKKNMHPLSGSHGAWELGYVSGKGLPGRRCLVATPFRGNRR